MCASRVGWVANLQTVYGGHGSLSGRNLHAMRAEIKGGKSKDGVGRTEQHREVQAPP